MVLFITLILCLLAYLAFRSNNFYWQSLGLGIISGTLILWINWGEPLPFPLSVNLLALPIYLIFAYFITKKESLDSAKVMKLVIGLILFFSASFIPGLTFSILLFFFALGLSKIQIL